MKVLLISDGYRAFNHRINIGFLLRLSEYCDIKIYGSKEHEIDSKAAPIKYDKGITGNDLVKLFNPDVIILILVGRFSVECVPEDIYKCNVPFIVLECDHYSYDMNKTIDTRLDVLDWYARKEIALVVRTHYYDDNEQLPIPTVWLPRSANEKEFFNDDLIERENKIAFFGSSDWIASYYKIRQSALFRLNEENLLCNNIGKVNSDLYPIKLRSYVGALGCSGGIYHTPLAKTFEIIASGTALLSNYICSENILFGEKQCYFKYKDDCNNVVEIGKILLEDIDIRNEIIKNGVEIVREKHTHKHRIKELYDILLSLTEGKEIPKKWGR